MRDLAKFARAFLLTLLIVSLCLTLISRFHRTKKKGANQPLVQTNRGELDFPGFRPRVRIKHLSEEETENYWSSPIGREALCNEIGQNAKDGLDGASYDEVLLKILMAQDQAGNICLAAVVKRLGWQLDTEEDPPWRNLQISKSHDLEVEILRRNPIVVADIIKQQYALDTVRADVRSIPLLLALKGRASCPDIHLTVNILRQDENAFAESFDDVRRTLCRE
jgi:hypothetical protein